LNINYIHLTIQPKSAVCKPTLLRKACISNQKQQLLLEVLDHNDCVGNPDFMPFAAPRRDRCFSLAGVSVLFQWNALWRVTNNSILVVHNLVVALAMVPVTVVVILQEEVLVCAVGSEGNGSNSETGEKTLEAVPAGEGTGVAPSLAG
jgi:hypothetical protein